MPARNVVVRGTNDKPVASKILAEFFESHPSAPGGGELFLGYPITTTIEGRRPIDAVYVSPHLGVVVFDLVEGTDLSGYEDRQDDAATRLEVRLKLHSDLVKRRKLQTDIHAITFAPGITELGIEEDLDYPVANSSTLPTALSDISTAGTSEDIHRRTISALQSISGIRRTSRPRSVDDNDSRGAKLKRLENSIATLDSQQSRAVIETARDVQRIRGLAGSGKTVVLALKAAYLHAQHPEWRIGVTFNTRSLSAQFRRLIHNFSIEQAGDEPDWNRIHVLPSWGAPGAGSRDGVYHRFCTENNVLYRDFRTAKQEFGSSNAMRGVVRAALAEAADIRQSFDVLLVDEAQDLPGEFLRLCYEMLGEEKRLVYAYDELQTLNGAGLAPPEEIFGVDGNGSPRVSFERGNDEGRRDIILEKCYRNSRPLLVTAHALGFGIYRDPPEKATTGLVQIFEQKDLWDDIGYRLLDGSLEDGDRVVLGRDEDSSPGFLENHSPPDDLLGFHSFESNAAQAKWIADEIEKNLKEDELLANDIIVVNPDPFTTRQNVGRIRAELFERGIQSHLAGVDTDADVFFKQSEDSITFTGIYRAKGNEAGMVYVINAHEAFTGDVNLARIRNRLFTAITRSKAWVRVAGIGEEMDALIDEYKKVRSRNFTLDFRYPTAEERTTLQILHRDMSRATESRVKKYGQSLQSLLADLEAGEVYPEDLDPQTMQRLANILRDAKR